MEIKEVKENYNIIQHNCNALSLQAHLITEGVKKEVLDIFIPQYEKVVHPLIYPLIAGGDEG